jgi:hypothetical protein
MVKGLQAHLSRKYGEGNYVLSWWLPTIYLDYETIEEKKLSRSDVENEAARFLTGFTGIHSVLTRTQLQSGLVPQTKLGQAASRSWNPQVSGDLLVFQKDGWFLADKDANYASMHGAPWGYDARVPLAFVGTRWIETGRQGGEAGPVDIAATLAHLLDIPAPTGCEGRVLTEILKK